MSVDGKVCTTCRLCEITCSMAHLGEVNPGRARVRVREDALSGTGQAVVCRQCPKPKCVEACHHFALRQDPVLGVPVIDPARCRGSACLECVAACPHGAMFYDPLERTPVACDLCGGEPTCTKFCRAYPHLPRAALSYA
jgi:Fe-S-cluster-containing hydrogenase component 2